MVETVKYDSFSMGELQGEWLIELFKDNCMPCKMLARSLDRFRDSTNILKVHLEDEAAIKRAVTNLKVQSVPTLLFVRDGELLHQSAGFKTPADLVSLLTKHFESTQVPA